MKMEQANDIIRNLGFVVLGNPKMFKHFYLGNGSTATGKAVTLSEVQEKFDSKNEVQPAVFVTYKSWSAEGDDLCDYHIEESRWVPVEKLEEFLVTRGVLKMEVQYG